MKYQQLLTAVIITASIGALYLLPLTIPMNSAQAKLIISPHAKPLNVKTDTCTDVLNHCKPPLTLPIKKIIKEPGGCLCPVETNLPNSPIQKEVNDLN
jgi:hypothetical protein